MGVEAARAAFTAYLEEFRRIAPDPAADPATLADRFFCVPFTYVDDEEHHGCATREQVTARVTAIVDRARSDGFGRTEVDRMDFRELARHAVALDLGTTRFDPDDRPVLRLDVHYVLLRGDRDEWRISLMVARGSVPRAAG